MSSFRTLPAAGRLSAGVALILVTVVVSGVSNFVNFRAVQGTNVDAWLAVRNLAVAAMLVPLALVVQRGARTRLTHAAWARLVGIGFVGGAVPFLLFFHGFQMAAQQGGAASASLGFRSLFLMASLLGVLVLRERMPRRFALGVAFLFVGNLLLLGLTGPLWTDGTPFVLVATALWAIEYTWSKRTMASLPSGTVALGRMGFGGLFLLGYLALSGQMLAIAGFGAADWMNLGLSALLLFAFVSTWYAGLKTVDLSVATSLLVLGFPVTWALGVLATGSAPPALQLVGAAAIVVGVTLVLRLDSLRRGWESFARWARSLHVRME